MSSYDGSYRIKATIDSSSINKGVSNVGSSLGGLEKMLGKLAGVIAATFSVKVIASFGKACIDVASGLNEVANVVNKSFEGVTDGTAAIDDLANTAIQKLGISRLTAYQTGSTFMAMGKSMVASADNAETMALELTKLSANMASFYNVSQDLAATALKSVYTGETETLKQYGIVMTETNLKEFALAQGIKKAYSAMSQSEKVMLRYNYVMQQTSFIGNDFEDTQSGWANQTRILTESWKEFMGVIGSGLTSVLIPVLNTLNAIVAELINIAKEIGAVLNSLGIGMGALSEDTSSGVNSYNALTDSVDEYSDAVDTAVAKQSGLQGFQELNVITTASSGSGSEEKQAEADAEFELAQNTKLAGDEAVETASKFGFIRDAFESLMGYFSKYGTEISNLYNVYLKPFVTSAQNLIRSLVSFIEKVITPLWPAIQAGLEAFVKVAFDRIEGLIKVITGILDILSGILDFITGVFTGDWELAWQGIQEVFKGVLEVIWGVFQAVFGSLLDIVEGFINVGVELIQYIGSVIYNIFEGVFSFLGGIFEGIFNVAQDAWNGLVNGARWAWNGICSVFSSLASFFKGIFTTAWTAVKNVFSTGGKIFDGIKDGIVAAFKAIVNALITGINKVVSIPFKGINAALTTIRDIEFLGIKPFKGVINTISIPEIPKLATGGVTTGATLAMIGEAGSEVVLPLENNTGWMDSLADKLAGKMGSSVTFKVEGDPYGIFKVTQQQAKDYLRRTGMEAF